MLNQLYLILVVSLFSLNIAYGQKLITLSGIGTLNSRGSGKDLAAIAKKSKLSLKSVMHSDGGTMVGVFNGKEELFAVQLTPEIVSEENRDAKIPLTKLGSQEIELIYTNNPSYKTKEGIGPGSSVVAAEAIYGTSKIVGEEYLFAEFANHPKNDKCVMGFQVDGSTVRSVGYDISSGKKVPEQIKIMAIQVSCKEDCIPEDQWTAEDEALQRRFVENIAHFEFNFGDDKYKLTRDGKLSIKNRKANTSDALKKIAKQDQQYSSYKFHDLALLESGRETLEGYISQVHVLDLKKAVVESTFQKCSNWKDGFYIDDKKLYYFCEYHCEKGVVHQLDETTKKFKEINNREVCERAKKANKIKFQPAKVTRTLDSEGREFKSSYAPVKVCRTTKK